MNKNLKSPVNADFFRIDYYFDYIIISTILSDCIILPFELRFQNLFNIPIIDDLIILINDLIDE